MTSRHTQWSVFGIVLSLLMLEATIGCQVVFPLKEVEFHNKLRCDCRCDGAGSRQAPIVASSDDAEEGPTGNVSLAENTLNLGSQIVGLRFDRVMLPPRARIQNAYVQFTATTGNSISTTLVISAEASVTPATFTATAGDISGRTVSAGIPWLPPPWGGGDGAGPAQQTPELKTLLQELVDLPGWTDASAIVLRIEGSGQRSATSFDGGPGAPVLVVTYDATVEATLPVCASTDAERDDNGQLTSASAIAECARVEDTIEGLGQACGYPTPCDCVVNDVPDHSDSGQSAVCAQPCAETAVDGTCSNFDPNAFAACLQQTGSIAACKQFVEATNVPGDSPVCVDSGSPVAFHLFGRRSQCNVDGSAEIRVGDREPKQDPATAGIVEILGGPCPGGGCSVAPYFDLHMAPITFAVKFHSDPTFRDLKASGRAAEAAVVDATGTTFFANAITGTGSGRRSSDATPGLAVSATNASPLDLAIDWSAGTCGVLGNLATAVDGETPDGLCEGDGATACTADSPDCDDAGGPCVLDTSDEEAMTVDVTLLGTIVNQPPTAIAGPDRTLECTSPDGASFTLDGRDSTDPDGDLSLLRWRQGGRIGPEVSTDSVTRQTVGVGSSETYALLAVDGHAQTDLDEVTVAVVDTTPPSVSCNAPATIVPPAHAVSITATATDVCTATPVIPALVGYECFRINGAGKRIDKTNACKVTLAGNTITIQPPQGIGTHIAWTAQAVDASGNVGTAACEVVVVNPAH